MRSHTGLQKVQTPRWKRHPDELMELLVAVNRIPVASAECEHGFSKINLICTCLSAHIHHYIFTLPKSCWTPQLNSIQSRMWGRGRPKDTELPETHAVKQRAGGGESGHGSDVGCFGQLNMVSILSINRPPCMFVMFYKLDLLRNELLTVYFKSHLWWCGHLPMLCIV